MTVKTPHLGDTTTTVLVMEWLVDIGDAITLGDDIVLVETDKTELAIPSPASGVLIEIIAEEGHDVAVGAPLCRLESGSGAG